MTENDAAQNEPSQHSSSLTGDGLATRLPDTQGDTPATTDSLQDSQGESSSQGLRRSSRIQKLKDGGKTKNWSILRDRKPDLHLINFIWDRACRLAPDQLKAEDVDYQEVATIFNVIDALCNNKSRLQLNTKLSTKAIHQADLVKVPTRYSEALAHPMRQQWLRAMKDEIAQLEARGTWKVIQRK
ncbi:hypothetical protein E4U59_000324 [Claviceps monticola]|nr:hypothetical protein E4U59_000324 [Claviceps monticola]